MADTLLAGGAADSLFVGRSDETRRLSAAVERLSGGHGGVVWIEGGPGLGKSRLLRESLAASEVTGWARAGDLRHSGPLGSFLACLDEVASHRPALARSTGQLQVTGDLTPLLRHLRWSCQDEPMVLVADDLHLADNASLAAWGQLCRMTRAVPLLLVAGARTSAHPDFEVLRVPLRRHAATTLQLAPLTDAEATELAHALGFHPHVVSSAVRDAGGNPAYLRQLHTGRVDPSRPLRVLVADHLSTLSERARQTLALLALSPPGISVSELVVRSPLTSDELKEALDEAVLGAILVSSGGVVGFRHPVVRRVLRGDRSAV